MKAKYFVALALLTLVSTPAFAGWVIDKDHTKVSFSVQHLMLSRVEGEFGEFEGTINLDTSDFTKSSAKGTVKLASINTRQPKRDDHLRSPDFFDVAKFPTMTLETRSITKSGNKYVADAVLTIRGISKNVKLDLEYLGTQKSPWGTTSAGIIARTTISRKDFGMTWNKALEAGGVLVGDAVDISIHMEAVQQ